MPTTFKTLLATNQASRNAGDRVNGKVSRAQPSALLAEYAFLGTEAAGDLILIGYLPKGSRPLVHNWRISSEGVGGTTGTVATLGIESNDDEFSATAVAITAAGNVAVTPLAALGLEHVPLAAETAVYAKLGLASGSFTAGKLIKFNLPYFLP